MIWMLSQHLVVCGLLALLVGVLCRLLKLSPATRHTLWFVVLLKVLLPLPIVWPWGVPMPTEMLAKPISVPAVPRSTAPPIEIPRMPQEFVVAIDEAAAHAAPVQTKATESLISSVWRWFDATRAVVLLWFVASAAIIGGQLYNHARFRRRMRLGNAPPEWLVHGVTEIGQKLGMEAPEVSVVDGAPSPCVYGLLKTKLIIPEALLEAVPCERWACILTHEFAHLKRRDHWVRWFELVTGGIWFWNPVYWIARRNLRANAELACDAWVVWALPEQRRVYAETLIDVSELIAKSPQPIAALGMGVRGVRLDFERRLKMILHERNAQHMTWKAGALAALLAITAMPAWTQDRTAPATPPINEIATPREPAATDPQAEKTEETSSIEKALKSPVNIQFEDQHISKIVDFLAEFLGVNILIDQGAVKPAVNRYIPPKGTLWGKKNRQDGRNYTSDGLLPSIDLKGTNPSALLDQWTQSLNLTYKVMSTHIFISTAEQMEKDGALITTSQFPPIDSAQMTEALAKPMDWSYDEEHIAVAANRLSEHLSFPIFVDARIVSPPPSPIGIYAEPMAPRPALPEEPVVADPELDRQYVTDGIVHEIVLRDIPLEGALKALTEPLNLAYAVKGNFIWITSPVRLDAQEFTYPMVPADAEELGKALLVPINIEFEATHLTHILHFLRDFLNINIVVDQRALPEMEKARQPNPPYLIKVDDTYVPSGYVGSIRVINVPLRDVLNALLVPLGLTYRVDRNAIFVTTPEFVETRSEVAPVNAPPGDAESKVEKALNAPINIEFEAQHISAILAFVSDYLSVNIATDFRAIKPVRKAAGLAGQPGVPALPPGPGAPSPAPGSAQPIISPPAAVPDVPIDPVLDAMYVTDGMVPYVKLVDMPMKEALNALLEPLNLAYEVHPNYIWITAKERKIKDDWSDPPAPEGAPAISDKLDAPIGLEFENQHITASLGFVAKYMDLSIKYDARAVPPPRNGATYFEVIDGKPVSTGMFPYIRLSDVPLKDTLKALLIPMGLTYRITPDFIVITSPELAQTTKTDEWANVPYLSEEIRSDSAVVAPPQDSIPTPQAAAALRKNVPVARTDVKLTRIIKWNDGKYRAEIMSGLSDRSRLYKPGEVV